MRRSSFLGIVLALLVVSPNRICLAKTSDPSLKQILAGINKDLAYAESDSRSQAALIIELYGSKNATSARAEQLYGKAKADYDGILAELNGDIVEKIKRPKPLDLKRAESDLNAFSTFADKQTTAWIIKNPDFKISRADPSKARLYWDNATMGTDAGSGSPVAGGASIISSISPIGTIVVTAVMSLVNEIDKLNDQSRKDEAALLETTRWLDWSVIANPKALVTQTPTTNPATVPPTSDVPKPKH